MVAFNLAQPLVETVLGRWGGLNTETGQRNLPPGASPLCHDVDFIVGGLGPRPGLTTVINDNLITNIPYIKGTTLASVSAAPAREVLYQDDDEILENSIATPVIPADNTLAPIQNNAIAISENFDYQELIALSNFGFNEVSQSNGLVTNGYDQPRTYDGVTVGRVSQAGPSAAILSVTALEATYDIEPSSLSGITQQLGVTIDAIAEETPGQYTTFVDTPGIFNVGDTITITGASNFNGNWTISQSAQPSGSTTPVDRFVFSGIVGLGDIDHGTCYSALTTCTLVTAPSPALAVGQSITIAGASVGSYDGTYTIVSVVNPTTFTFNASAGNLGTSGDGTIAFSSSMMAAGTRYAVYMFQMFDGFITPASPPTKFTTTSSDNTLVFSGLQTGPANVTKRIVAVTAAASGIGGPYYYVPASNNGYGTTILDDNTTTGFSATLSDVIITTGIDITAAGNDLLRTREIGEYVKGLQYAGRMFYQGESVKVDNLPGMSFDGGSINANYPWTFTSPNTQMSLATSKIYGFAFKIYNPGAGIVNPNAQIPTDYISRVCGNDAFGVPTLQNGFDYSVRITGYTDLTGEGTMLALSLDNTYFPVNDIVQTGALEIGPLKFSLDFQLTSLTAAGATLKVYPVDLPAGGSVFIDRIEIFPTETPIYNNQLGASYILNPQALDSITGALDVSLFTSQPITNQFLFPNQNALFMTTEDRIFSTQDTAGSEPDGWSIVQITDSAGSFGPLAVDTAEAWAVTAERRGAYLFDGGTPIKISQEIQQLWSYIYTPSANRTWVKIDKYQQRVLIGVPMVTPNQWMPDAPANATPTTPNVILMCSYLGLPTGASVADSPGVHPSSFTGALLTRDFTRKWTCWTIASPTGVWVDQSDNSQQLWLGGTGTGKIYKLDPTVYTDDGAAIPQVYFTYGFSDEVNNQGNRLGNVRKLFAYLTSTITGAGDLIISTYPETIESSTWATTLPGFPLTNPYLGDLNSPLNDTGNYMFFKLATDRVAGSYFNIRRMVVGTSQDPKISVSGR